MGTIRYVRSVAIPVCSQQLAEAVVLSARFEGLCRDSSALDECSELRGLVVAQ